MPARTIFISGILPADREIPMFSLPVIINDIKKESLIIVDLRSVLKSKFLLFWEKIICEQKMSSNIRIKVGVNFLGGKL